jgi:hypothetical protein
MTINLRDSPAYDWLIEEFPPLLRFALVMLLALLLIVTLSRLGGENLRSGRDGATATTGRASGSLDFAGPTPAELIPLLSPNLGISR